MKRMVIGNLAHVDAGKTTLSEAMLYISGKIKNLGRVDHQNAYLDYETLERNRKITIFSKQAVFNWRDCALTLLDTPGHVDFSSEMERVLQVLDVAILIVSGSDGIQPHTKTIWQLLDHYHVPTVIFVNKMDMPSTSKEKLLANLQQELHANCLDFTMDKALLNEEISLCDDDLLETYMQHGDLSNDDISNALMSRKLFPCYFGSALKNEGVDHLLDGLVNYTKVADDKTSFSANVFKIAHDKQGTRLAYMKVLSGTLKVKDTLLPDEKADQLRVYSGYKYEVVQEASAGMVVAVKGLKSVYAGDVLGQGKKLSSPVLESCMNYALVLPLGVDSHQVLPYMKQLAEEDPMLHVNYDTKTNEIRMQLMGEIQIEVLKQTILERFNLAVDFDHGQVLYKETIANPVLGVGHYEPLRHYAEVQLLLEPAPRGSGITITSDCSEDELTRHWQNLILTHLQEKEHLGVLTGSPLTDVKITLLIGKAHLKHTEGGDFRQATYRAVRQGLMHAQNILLEPYYHFKAHLPTNSLSRFIFDIDKMHGTYEIVDSSNDTTTLHGEVPVSQMQSYMTTFIAYTKGLGQLDYELTGYKPCFNQEEIVEEMQYDPKADLDNPCDSVFCSHGAGYNVSYDEVYKKMHLEAHWPKKEIIKQQYQPRKTTISDDDATLSQIFERTYGPIQTNWKERLGYEKKNKEVEVSQKAQRKPCLIVDGYNVIYAWEELANLARVNLDAARGRLIDALCNYQGYKQCLLILVFDAYLVKDNPGSIDKYHNIYIVYTKEAQTADMFIERTTHEMASLFQISVVTSDALEQLIVSSKGANRISSREFISEVKYVARHNLKEFLDKQKTSHAFPLEDVKNYQDE